MANITIQSILERYKTSNPEINYVGFDVESYLIVNNTVPEIVCMSFYDVRRDDAPGYLLNTIEGVRHLAELLMDDSVHLIAHNAFFDMVTSSVLSPQLFALIFRAYDNGRIHCTKLREMLLLVGGSDNYGEVRNVTQGTIAPVSGVSLAGCIWNYFGKDITASKVRTSGKNSPVNDVWRLRYNELHDVPLDEWPVEAVTYAIEDSYYAMGVFLAQDIKAKRISRPIMAAHGGTGTIIDDAPRQACVEFCFQYMSFKTGVKVDQNMIQAANDAIMVDHQKLVNRVSDFGFYKAVKKHKRGYKIVKKNVRACFKRAYQVLQYSEPSIYTETSLAKNAPEISTAKGPRDNLLRMIDTAIDKERTPTTRIPLIKGLLDELQILSDALRTFAECESLWKEANTFIKGLKRSRLSRDERIRYNLHGLVATGRSSSADPNMQNLPRGGAVRACIQPTEGHVFVINDYSNAEMRSLAEVNWIEQEGVSSLAIEYRKDPHFDPHLFAAYQMLNIEQGMNLTFDEAKAIYADKKHAQYKLMKKFRTLAKILNFGLAGGLSHVSFVDYARGYKVYLTIGESKKLCDMWRQVWSEMGVYFNRRGQMFREDPITGERNTTDAERTYLFKGSNRARYLRKYTVACNTCFQGISADGAKQAVIRAFKECYFMKKSPLYGCKPIMFVHDEIVLECPYDPNDHKKASDAALRLSKVMEVCMEQYTPNIPAIAEPTLSTRWTKDAESDVIDGVVQLWTPPTVDDAEDEPIIVVDPAEQLRIAAVRVSVIARIEQLSEDL
jgi:hypothetical protein